MIQVYHGRGKGKTSAAIGGAVRAAGQGLGALVVQFMKSAGASSGEVNALASLCPPVEVLRADLPYSIFRPPGRAARDLLAARTRELFGEASRRVASGRYRFVVLDELGMALGRGWITRQDAERLLARTPADCELVVTGRHVPRWLLERADLVTQMRNVKHPYQRGRQARRGIEY